MLSARELGAICEIEVTGHSYEIEEFIDLDDGRRIVWRRDRGWNSSGDSSMTSPACQIARECMHALEDDNETVYSYFDALMGRLNDMGIAVNPESVYAAPFRIELGPNLKRLLPRAAHEVLSERQRGL